MLARGSDDASSPPRVDGDDGAGSPPLLAVQALDIPAIAERVGVSPRGLLSALLAGSDVGDGASPPTTVVVPIVQARVARASEHPDDDRGSLPTVREEGAVDAEATRGVDDDDGSADDESFDRNHDLRSSVSRDLLARRARRAAATDAANADAVAALFAAQGADLADARAPLLASVSRPPRRETDELAEETDQPAAPLAYLVGIPATSPLVPEASFGTPHTQTLTLNVDAREAIARALADASDGAVGEARAAAAAASAAAAAESSLRAASSSSEPSRSSSFASTLLRSNGVDSASTNRVCFGGDGSSSPRDVVVRRVIFAAPTTTDLDGDVAAAPRDLKCGGTSTGLSLPSAVQRVTLEMRGDLNRREGTEIATENVADDEVRTRDGRVAAFGDLRATATVTRRVPLVGWAILAAAVLSLSGVGTAVDAQRSRPLVQCAWRAESCLLVVAPWAWWSLRRQGWRGLADPALRRRVFLAAACWSGWFVTLFYGLDNTSIAHAYMLTNTTSGFIVAYNLVTRRERVPASHIVGVAVALVGAATVMWDSERRRISAETGVEDDGSDRTRDRNRRSPTLVGDAVVAAGAATGAAFLLLAKSVRDKVELSHALLAQMALNLPIVFVGGAVFEGMSLTRPLDPVVGAFGWLTRRQIASQLFITLCGTIVGTAGYVASLKYLAPTVVSVAMLMEPVLASLFGWLAGFEPLPTAPTAAGMAAVFAGTAIITLHAGRSRVRAVNIDTHRG